MSYLLKFELFKILSIVRIRFERCWSRSLNASIRLFSVSTVCMRLSDAVRTCEKVLTSLGLHLRGGAVNTVVV